MQKMQTLSGEKLAKIMKEKGLKFIMVDGQIRELELDGMKFIADWNYFKAIGPATKEKKVYKIKVHESPWGPDNTFDDAESAAEFGLKLFRSEAFTVEPTTIEIPDVME